MTRAGTMALGVAVAALAGVIALGAATGSIPAFLVLVEVTIWRDLDDGNLYVGAREEGGLWRRHPAALDLSATSASGRFQRSGTVRLTAPLTGGAEAAVEAVVWRSVADPAHLHLSVRLADRGRPWRTVDAPLVMRVYEPREWQRYERADPVSVDVPFHGPLSDARVTGPLVVFTVEPGFTVESGEAWTDAGGWGLSKDVYVLDTATGKYWRAFDYWHSFDYEYLDWPGRLTTAGARLIAWDERQVRRIGLAGHQDAAPYEAEGIHALSVSPDGAKVAVVEEDGALTVLDTATGEALLRVAGRTELAALLPDAPARAFLLDWNAASDRLAVAASDRLAVAASWQEDSQTGILTLDGELRVLPPNAGNLSPDFRYAIRPHEVRGPYEDRNWPWSGFDVIETASGRVVRSVTVVRDNFILSRGWQPDANRYSWFEMDRHTPGPCGYDLRERQLSEAGSVTAALTCGAGPPDVAVSQAMRWEAGGRTSAVGPRILDVASGAIGQPTRDEWYGLRMEGARLTTRGSCWSNEAGQACGLFLEGRPVWNGKVEAVGVVDLAEPLALRDVGLLDSPRASANPPAPPDPAEMVGPLFAWSVAGGYERRVDTAGNERFRPIRRVMVRDEGTGRSWRALDYSLAGGIWPARGGFIVQHDNALRFVTPNGRARTLLVDDRIAHPDNRLSVHFSPSGEKVIVSLHMREAFDVALVALALASGEELLRVESDAPRFDKILRERREYWSQSFHMAVPPPAFVPLAWNADETAFTVALGSYYRGGPFGLFHLNGAFIQFPPDAGYVPPSGAPAFGRGPRPSERAGVSCPGSADLIQWCSVLLDGVTVGEGRWAEAIGFVTLD